MADDTDNVFSPLTDADERLRDSGFTYDWSRRLKERS